MMCASQNHLTFGEIKIYKIVVREKDAKAKEASQPEPLKPLS